MSIENVTMLHLTDGRTVIGYELETNDESESMILGYPVVLHFEYPDKINTAVYGSQYSPFSEHGEVMFLSQGIQAVSIPDGRVAKFYENLVKYYQSLRVNIEPAGKIADRMEDDEPTEEEIDQFLTELENVISDESDNVFDEKSDNQEKTLDNTDGNVVNLPLRKKNGSTVH